MRQFLIASRLATNLARVRFYRTIPITQFNLVSRKLESPVSSKLMSWNSVRRHISSAKLKVVSPEFLEACRDGDVEVVKKLLADPRVDVTGFDKVIKNIEFDNNLRCMLT